MLLLSWYFIYAAYVNCGPDHRAGSLHKGPAIVPRRYICGWDFYPGFELLVDQLC